MRNIEEQKTWKPQNLSKSSRPCDRTKPARGGSEVDASFLMPAPRSQKGHRSRTLQYVSMQAGRACKALSRRSMLPPYSVRLAVSRPMSQLLASDSK